MAKKAAKKSASSGDHPTRDFLTALHTTLKKHADISTNLANALTANTTGSTSNLPISALHTLAASAHTVAASAHTLAAATHPNINLGFSFVLSTLRRILARLNGNPSQNVDPTIPMSSAAPNATPVPLQAAIDRDIYQNMLVFPLSSIDLSETATDLAQEIIDFATSGA